jgi:membrane protein implicated in regulation of membrane protease activity
MLLILLSLLIAGLSWLATGNLYISFGIFFIFSGYLFLIGKPMMNRRLQINERMHQCYQFINSTIISLSVKNTLSSALEAINQQLPKPLIKEMEQGQHMEPYELLRFLETYFPFKVYSLFTRIISLYLEQGGDIVEMAGLLLGNARRLETYNRKEENAAKRKLSNFITLWILTMVILIMSRFLISDLYLRMMSGLYFQIGMGIFFVFMLFSLHRWIVSFSVKRTYEN